MKARLPKGVGGPTNMQGMIKQAQKMQEEMEAKQAELDVMEYEVQAGGGVVADSIPENEYMESVNKSMAVINAIKEAAKL